MSQFDHLGDPLRIGLLRAPLAYTLARSKAHRAFAVAFFGDKRDIAKKELNPA